MGEKSNAGKLIEGMQLKIGRLKPAKPAAKMRLVVLTVEGDAQAVCGALMEAVGLVKSSGEPAKG